MFFVIFMVMIAVCTIAICAKTKQGFGIFWLNFPFKQYLHCVAVDKLMDEDTDLADRETKIAELIRF